MSHLPSYNSEPVNPDSRLLPPGWVQQYDPNYKTWFYVNTQEQPPRSSWVHPLGPLPPPPLPPSGYPPYGAPPNNNRDQGTYPHGGEWNHGGPPHQQWNHGYGSPPRSGWGGPPHGGWGSPPHGGGYGGYGHSGSPHGHHGSPHGHHGRHSPEGQRGWFGGGHHQNNEYREEYEHPAQKRSGGMGIGTAVAAGGVGLLGGVLLADAFEDSHDDGYEQGFDNGADFGGGDQWDN